MRLILILAVALTWAWSTNRLPTKAQVRDAVTSVKKVLTSAEKGSKKTREKIERAEKWLDS